MYDARIKYTSAILSPIAVAGNTTAEQTFSNVPQVRVGDMILGINKPTAQAGLAIGNYRVAGDGQVAIVFVNVTAAPITPTASETYDIAIMAKQPK